MTAYATLSPPFYQYIFGYGIVLVMAVVGVALRLMRRKRGADSVVAAAGTNLLLPACWFVAAMAVTYMPHVAFQRKMIMGADIPLSLLAGRMERRLAIAQARG